MPIKRTPEEIAKQGPVLLARLGRSLTAVEGRELGASEELATVLRILLDSTNQGNRGMARLAAAAGVQLPAVLVSGEPAGVSAAPRDLVFSFGNLPTSDTPGPGQPQAPRRLPFAAWVDAVSVVAPGSQKRRQSWSQFVTLMANTGGAHLSTEYHDFLVTNDRFSTIGMPLQEYFLRQIGWQVEDVLARVVAQSGHPVLPRTRQLELLPRVPTWMEFRDKPGKFLEVAVAVHVSDDAVGEVEVMRFTGRGRVHRILHNGGRPDVDLQVRLVIDDPTTGRQYEQDAEVGSEMPDWYGK
ncbi:hypothetical protein [Curtobacterium flaccumfaciens]|uniref:hypothetical protein n=1 Tax=Curtobacterium flaccumfaciens TaxID=2035 RepID=UPI0012685439|nr:hypothetical protein [Curtobacterium flaccumfaciens]